MYGETGVALLQNPPFPHPCRPTPVSTLHTPNTLIYPPLPKPNTKANSQKQEHKINIPGEKEIRPIHTQKWQEN